jgi:hypothetical protein
VIRTRVFRAGREFAGGPQSALYLLFPVSPLLRAQEERDSLPDQSRDGFPRNGGDVPQLLQLTFAKLDLRPNHANMLSP